MKLSYSTRNGKDRSRLFKKNHGPAKNRRRKGALERLILQLDSGMKPAKKQMPARPLSEDEREAIKKQISLLNKVTHG